MAFNIEYVYTVLDRFSKPLQRLKKKLNESKSISQKLGAAFALAGQKVANAAKKMVRNVKSVSKSFANLRRKMAQVKDQAGKLEGAIGSAAIFVGLRSTVVESMNVEDALQDLVRVGDLTANQLNTVENAMEDLSEELGKSKVGLLQQAFEGLKLGIPTEELTEFVKLAARTGIAFDMVDREAGRALGSLRDKLTLSTESLGHLMDSVNFVADNFSADGARMINIIERTSGTMKLLEFPPEVVAGLAGFADQIETTSELAASGLNQMFARMQKNPRMVKKLMQDPVGALIDHFEKFNKVDPALRFAVIEKRFGLEAARFVAKAITNVEKFEKTMRAAASQKALNSMLRELQNRSGRTSTLFKILGAVSTNILGDIGNAIKPVTVAIAKMAINFGKFIKKLIENNPTLVKWIAIIITAVTVIGSLAIALGVMAVVVKVAMFGLTLLGSKLLLLGSLFMLLTSPVGLIILAIGLLVVAIGYLWYEWDSIVSAMGAEWDQFANYVSGIIDDLVVKFQEFVDWIKSIPSKIFSSLGSLAGDFNFDKITNIFGGSEDNANDVATRRQAAVNTNVSIDGNISVGASGGAVINNANINANTGNNLAALQ
jgi:TP901 family phage tail tape measure protein